MAWFPRIFAALLCIPFFALSAQVQYRNVADSLGIVHYYGAGPHAGGVSLCDYNNDGRDDISLGSGLGDSLYFYRNTPGGYILENPPLASYLGESKHILWVDIDNDGDQDLFVAGLHGNRLYENQGGLNLVDITSAAGLPADSMPTFGVCFGDYNNDSYLDLYVTNRTYNYVFSSHTNYLFRNNGPSSGSGPVTFTDVTTASGTADGGKAPFGASFVDYDLDGDPDLYAFQDKNFGNTLLRNNGDGTFTDVSVASGTDLRIDAMCSNVGDYDNDGDLDIYVTNIQHGNHLLENQGNGTFADATDSAGLGFYGIGWGSLWLDYDHDMDLDLYVSAQRQPHWFPSSQMYENMGALGSHGQDTFGIPPNIGFAGDSLLSFASAAGDLNQDGHPDIVVCNSLQDSSAVWFSNGGSGNQWIKIELEGSVSNRDAVGSLISVYSAGVRQIRYTSCGNGYLGQSSPVEIFGLDKTLFADSVVVTWPGGIRGVSYNLSAGQIHKITESVPFDWKPVDELAEGLDELIGLKISYSADDQLLKFHWETLEEKYLCVQLLDLRGVVLNKKVWAGREGSGDVSLENLPGGLYVYEVVYGGERLFGKVLKR